jgi:uncharacterized protein YfkK (UPF0435 family)
LVNGGIIPDEDLTEEEIEELITGAMNWEQMMNLGVIKSEDTSKGDKNSGDGQKMVSREKFIAILSSEVQENKFSKSKPKRQAKKETASLGAKH